jgi:hypothetical protein
MLFWIIIKGWSLKKSNNVCKANSEYDVSGCVMPMFYVRNILCFKAFLYQLKQKIIVSLIAVSGTMINLTRVHV